MSEQKLVQLLQSTHARGTASGGKFEDGGAYVQAILMALAFVTPHKAFEARLKRMGSQRNVGDYFRDLRELLRDGITAASGAKLTQLTPELRKASGDLDKTKKIFELIYRGMRGADKPDLAPKETVDQIKKQNWTGYCKTDKGVVKWGKEADPHGRPPPPLWTSAKHLGARSAGRGDKTDVTIAYNESSQQWEVLADGGGMSVNPNTINVVQNHLKPVGFGGTARHKKDGIYTIDPSKLGSDLAYNHDSDSHGTVKPARRMTVEEYQRAVQATRDKWRKVE